MTQTTENKILNKINWQMLTFLLALTVAFFGGLRVAYHWNVGILSAINENKSNYENLKTQVTTNTEEIKDIKIWRKEVTAYYLPKAR